MGMNWSVLSEAAYKDLRWNLLVKVEESGNPKPTAYLDSADPTNPTIGVGFNLKDAFVRAAVLRTLGFAIPLNATEPAATRQANPTYGFQTVAVPVLRYYRHPFPPCITTGRGAP